MALRQTTSPLSWGEDATRAPLRKQRVAFPEVKRYGESVKHRDPFQAERRGDSAFLHHGQRFKLRANRSTLGWGDSHGVIGHEVHRERAA